ncbi:MAG: hypothetical protein ACM3JD_05995, partial [Rudaea sp.]
MTWQEQLTGNANEWLLERDSPGVRYLALRDLLDLDENDRELRAARKAAHRHGPVAAILGQMDETGYWVRPGPGYYPIYRSTIWSLTSLAQLGALISEDKRIARACAYVLDHSLTTGGQFTMTGAPSGTVDCLQGNLCWALLELGCDDSRLESAFEWMARSVTGEGVSPAADKQAAVRYYAGKYGPTFACGANNKQPCAWGAVKVMLAFGKLPRQDRTPVIKRAIKRGVDFLLGTEPAQAEYPNGYGLRPSRNWWKFGFPLFYITDLLQNVESLVSLGYARDPRLAQALGVIRDKQDEQGRWLLEYDYRGKIWTDF